MHLYSNKNIPFRAYFIAVFAICFVAIILSVLFIILPLRVDIISVLANFTFGIGVFLGELFVSRRTPFFRLRSFLFLPVTISITILCATFLFSEPSFYIMLIKIILIFVSAIIGEICGRI